MADLSTYATVGGQRSRVWLAAALTVVVFVAATNITFPLGRDQATYSLIGENLLRGRVLYRDLWDNKPPGIFFLYAVIVKVFGPVMWSVGVVDFLWVLAISACIFRYAKRYLGAPAAAIAMVLNAAWHSTGGYIHAAQPETFLTIFLFVALFLIDENGAGPERLVHRKAKSENGKAKIAIPDLSETRDPKSDERAFRFSNFAFRNFAAGLMFGAAFWMKYNALVFLPLLIFLPSVDRRPLDERPFRLRLAIPRRRWLTNTASLLVGFAVAIFLVLAYFIATGSWGALKEVQFEVLPRYGAMVYERQLHLWRWVLQRSYYFLGLWSAGMWLAALLLAWKRREVARLAPILALCVGGYVAAVAQGRLPSFYFETCYPFFAMCWGYVCVVAYQGFQSARAAFLQRGWRVATVLLWLVAANIVYLPLPAEAYELTEKYQSLSLWWRNPREFYSGYMWQIPLEKLHDQLEVVAYLEKESHPLDEVYVWGTSPLINFLTQRPFPTRFVSNLALISPWGPDRWRDELVRDLTQRRPRFIVVARHDRIWAVTYTSDDSEQCLKSLPGLAELLGREYRSVANWDDFEIYRLNDA